MCKYIAIHVPEKSCLPFSKKLPTFFKKARQLFFQHMEVCLTQVSHFFYIADCQINPVNLKHFLTPLCFFFE